VLLTHTPELLEPQWFIPVFCCLWLFICAVLSLGGGWFSLSREFRSDELVEGQRFRFRSGSIGRWPFPVTGYGKCLFLTVNDRGFRLSILFVFRPLSPPLFIPWAAVKSVESGRFLFMRYTLFRLKRGWPAIAIRGHAGEYLADAYARVPRTP
jgi:hypothetical protein